MDRELPERLKDQRESEVLRGDDAGGQTLMAVGTFIVARDVSADCLCMMFQHARLFMPRKHR